MLKNLLLIGGLFVSSATAAFDLSSGDEIQMKLNTTIARRTYATTFQKLARQAIEADNDEERITLNTSLRVLFEKMKTILTPSKLIILHTIEAEENARLALDHYTQSLSQIDEFIRLLEKYRARLLEDD